MEKTYYMDTYLKTLKCRITEVRHTDKAVEVRTNRTIFYPESGGQPGDRGMLGPYRVLDTRKAEDGDSVLIMDKNCAVNEGEELEAVLDWERRYKFMVIHTAQHLLSGLMFTMFGIGTVAVHQGDDYLTIETDRSEIAHETVDRLILAANNAIRDSHKIKYHELSHKEAENLGLRRSIKVDGDVRIVEIEDCDRIACGGIHVASTNEIRLIYCIGHEQIRGHVRLYFSCGAQALESALENSKIVQRLNTILSCKSDEIESRAEALVKNLAEAKSENERLEKELALKEIRSLIDENGFCALACPEGTDLQNYARSAPYFTDLALLAHCPNGDGMKWLIVLKGKYEKIDFNSLKSTVLVKINAKGGGRAPVFQGMAPINPKSEDGKKRLADFEKNFRTAVIG